MEQGLSTRKLIQRLLVLVVAMFAFLNRWNDTLATPLEAPAATVAQQAIGAQGWTAGKHTA